MSFEQIVNLAESIGVLGMMVVVLYTGYKGVWRWGRDFEKLEREKNEWREMALRGTNLAEGLAETVSTRRLFSEDK